MINQNDNYSLFTENSSLELAVISSVGGRPDQQDSSGYDMDDEGLITVVCDGMGGHDGGKLASSLAVSEMLELYAGRDASKPEADMLMDSAELIDSHIAGLSFPDGTRMQAGTTIVCAAVRQGRLHYLSVGDSRIYLLRNGELSCLTTDHNYFTKLRTDYLNGRLSAAQYEAEASKGEALVSFLGVGGLSMIDCNHTPIELLPEDRLLLTTDGLYKLLGDNDIREILEGFTNISDALQAFEMKARRISSHSGIARDNMTAAIIKVK